MIFLFAIYVVFEIVTVSAVKSCNRKGESFPKPHRRQTFVEGESISRITRLRAGNLFQSSFLVEYSG